MSQARKAERPEPLPPRDAAAPTALNSADPVRNFSLSMEERVRALTIGVPAWAERKRRIEDAEDRYVGQLVALHETLAAKGRPAAEIARAIGEAAAKYDLTKLNVLVAEHNRYYPIEANLPMDRAGNYLVYGRVWEREEPYSAERLVALAEGRLGSA